MISAFWHGFYFSYYVAFFHWSLFGTLARFCYKTSLNYPKFPYDNPVYKIMRFTIGNFFMNYYGIVFMNLDSNHVWSFMKTVWYPNVLLYICVGFFMVTGFGQKTKRPEKGKEEKDKDK